MSIILYTDNEIHKLIEKLIDVEEEIRNLPPLTSYDEDNNVWPRTNIPILAGRIHRLLLYYSSDFWWDMSHVSL